jgi:hypothetical protein
MLITLEAELTRGCLTPASKWHYSRLAARAYIIRGVLIILPMKHIGYPSKNLESNQFDRRY